MQIQAFFDPKTSTLTYVVMDEGTRDAIVIDPVLDYDSASGRTGLTALEPVMKHLADEQATLRLVLEPHAHADHLSGCQTLLRDAPGVQLAIGSGIRAVQTAFKEIFALPASFPTTGEQFDRLLEDGETFKAGSIGIRVLATRGHTPACCSYVIGDAVFTGDALFMPDGGTGRCDFPGGDATTLYRSVKRLYDLPDATRTFTGHDYQPGGRELAYQSTIGEHKKANIHIRASTTEAAFVAFRRQRDATLDAPRLLYPSIQVNIAAGKLPDPERDGRRFLKIPLDSAPLKD